MANSDLLLSLIRAGTKGDQALFRKTVEALIAEERSKQHHVLAERLADLLSNSNGSQPNRNLTTFDSQTQNGLYEIRPRKKISDLILPFEVAVSCLEMIEEYQRADLLRSYGLEPRHKILLSGPPGNGKTTLAEAIAEALMLPLFVVRYEGIIGSYLGETAQKLRKLFDFIRTQQCVLFFDEFDTLGKERGDEHETGEIKRVVSSLLLQMDSLPSYVVIVTATNHQELLDRAVWRRFQLRLDLPNPTEKQIEEWFTQFEETIGEQLSLNKKLLSSKFKGLSFSEIEEFTSDVMRRRILDGKERPLTEIVEERLVFWNNRFKPKKKVVIT
jgi:SpoVK/Ycf46/Vps4 family AAA+-type ATPase